MNDYDKIEYWVELAKYDMETAKVLMNNKKYLYFGFMCHQTIEKILKAVYVKKIKAMPPYIHGLKKIARESKIYDEFSEEQILLLATLEPLNIEGRYPTVKQEIYNSLDKEVCEKLVKDTEELMIWIKNKLDS